MNKLSVIIDEQGQVRCPLCHAEMWKLYWKDRRLDGKHNLIFTEWFGCRDCGKYIYDKHEDVILSQFIEKGEKDGKG